MVLQGLFGFASVLLVAAAVTAGIFFAMNYSENRNEYETPRSSNSGRSNASWNGYENWEGIQCTVCMSSIQDSPTKKLRCEHIFHTRCINRWLSESKKCPNCMRDVE